MLRQYFFLPLFFSFLVGLRWFSALEAVDVSKSDPSVSAQASVSQQLLRQELIEDLDRLASYEHYYHSLTGRFTLVLNRIGFQFSSRIRAEYDIRIVVASADFFLLNAISEKDGKIFDVVSVDQDFQVHSKFALPSPRREYLRAQAFKHLRLLREAPQGVSIPETGIYRGYFEYSLRSSSSQELHAFALGVKSPVDGDLIELSASSDEGLTLELESILAGDPVERSLARVEGAEEGLSVGQEALAQTIFLGEMGRYPKDLQELSKITRFQLRSEADSRSGDLIQGESKSPNPGRLVIEPIE